MPAGEELMPDNAGSIFDLFGMVCVLVLVATNGFFVAAEFSLVAVRRSRVTELVAAGRMNAAALQHAVTNLDANLAATQLGITISSLALGWIGEPALAHLIEPMLNYLPATLAAASSHLIAVIIAFIIIRRCTLFWVNSHPRAWRSSAAKARLYGWSVRWDCFCSFFGPQS